MHIPDDASPLPTGPAPSASLARWRHALRSPLNAILTATAVLEISPADSAAAVQARRIIARQTRNLAWIISDISDTSAAGPPQGATAPLGGREPHAVGERGGDTPSDVPPGR